MDISKDNKKKIIAFYLPQFHTIPENDKWWGKGFTEWTNTKKAKPLFEGHEQPKTPLNNNYYNLLDVTVMERQAELAKKYGVFGFCYYHYWFKNGKKLLEKPLEQMLSDSKVDIPFCFCWANENWTRNWDGGNREVMVEQDYGDSKDWKMHFDYLLNFFKDKRYITINNRPLLVIYKPEQIECFNDMIAEFDKLAKNEGFDGIIVFSQFPDICFDEKRDSYNIDYYIKFEPAMAVATQIDTNPSFKRKAFHFMRRTFIKVSFVNSILDRLKKRKDQHYMAAKKLEINNYDDIWNTILQKEPVSDKYISGGFVSWDNTARNKNGMMVKGASPLKFEKYMRALLQKTSPWNLVFVNAWNEWGEGAYLEPDERYKYAYLEALKKALEEN